MFFVTSTRHNVSEIRSEDHALEIVFTRQKERLGANPESPQRTQAGTNIREVRTPSPKFFTKEQNELLVQTFKKRMAMNFIIMFLV